MEADMKRGFGLNTHSLPTPESPILSTLLPFPADHYLSVPLPKKKGREKISDRTRSLQKLLPCNKKMKTADMLEEAFKYVKFLQAQLRALHSMPLFSTLPGSHQSSDFGVLGLLSRQQLLQVLLNSPSLQTILYSQALCVCSIEQVLPFQTS